MIDHLASDSRRGLLSAATRAAHRELDSAIRRNGYFSHGERYITYLRASLRARQALEAGLRAQPVLPAAAYETAPVLELDLRDLGGQPRPRPPAVPLEPAAAWGVLYVLLGAGMGARHLRQWAAALGFSASHGARHLALQAERAGAWPEFLARLNGLRFAAHEEAACLAGARGAFACFAACLAAPE